jgi:hypothetical protein
MSFMRRAAVVGMLGTVLQFGGCRFSEFEATLTLQSRDVAELLVRSWLLTPLEEAINAGIDRLFDKLEG